MLRTKGLLGTLLLGAAISAPLLTGGCAAHTRYYDDYYADYHPWDAREDHAYRAWLAERHYEWREYNRLTREQQRDYWRWRHNHPDRY